MLWQSGDGCVAQILCSALGHLRHVLDGVWWSRKQGGWFGGNGAVELHKGDVDDVTRTHSSKRLWLRRLVCTRQAHRHAHGQVATVGEGCREIGSWSRRLARWNNDLVGYHVDRPVVALACAHQSDGHKVARHQGGKVAHGFLGQCLHGIIGHDFGIGVDAWDNVGVGEPVCGIVLRQCVHEIRDGLACVWRWCVGHLNDVNANGVLRHSSCGCDGLHGGVDVLGEIHNGVRSGSRSQRTVASFSRRHLVHFMDGQGGHGATRVDALRHPDSSLGDSLLAIPGVLCRHNVAKTIEHHIHEGIPGVTQRLLQLLPVLGLLNQRLVVGRWTVGMQCFRFVGGVFPHALLKRHARQRLDHLDTFLRVCGLPSNTSFVKIVDVRRGKGMQLLKHALVVFSLPVPVHPASGIWFQQDDCAPRQQCMGIVARIDAQTHTRRWVRRGATIPLGGEHTMQLVQASSGTSRIVNDGREWALTRLVRQECRAGGDGILGRVVPHPAVGFVSAAKWWLVQQSDAVCTLRHAALL